MAGLARRRAQSHPVSVLRLETCILRLSCIASHRIVTHALNLVIRWPAFESPCKRIAIQLLAQLTFVTASKHTMPVEHTNFEHLKPPTRGSKTQKTPRLAKSLRAAPRRVARRPEGAAMQHATTTTKISAPPAHPRENMKLAARSTRRKLLSCAPPPRPPRPTHAVDERALPRPKSSKNAPDQKKFTPPR